MRDVVFTQFFSIISYLLTLGRNLLVILFNIFLLLNYNQSQCEKMQDYKIQKKNREESLKHFNVSNTNE